MDRSLWLAVLAAFVLTSIPTAAGMLNAPPGGVWTGILTRNTADVNGYLSMIEEVRQGSLRTRNLFTAEPHPAFQIRPLWIGIGLAGRILPFSNVILMEMARWFTSLGLLIILAFIARRISSTSREAVITFLLLTLGCGIGWSQLVQDPPDLRIVETSTFLTLVSPPLYTTSLSLVLSVLLLVLRSRESEKKFLYGVAAGCCALWLGLDRPFSLATLAVAITGLFVTDLIRTQLSWKNWIALLPLAAGALIAVLYQYQSLQNVPVYATWNHQHILPTPEWMRLFSSLGLLLPLAILGVRPFFSKDSSFAILTLFFIAGSLFFSHLPLGFQERFLEGLSVATAVFAAYGMMELLRRFSHPVIQTLIATVLLVLLSLSHYYPLRNDLAAIARQSPPQYMPEKVVDGMRKVLDLAAKSEAILSTEASGNFLMAYSGRPVVLAQRIQTADYTRKAQLVQQYFRTPAKDPSSRKLFQQSLATWLFWGPEEAWLSRGAFHPSEAGYLSEQYNNGFISIFKLK